jgi:hypothetical protein
LRIFGSCQTRMFQNERFIQREEKVYEKSVPQLKRELQE